MHIQPTEERIVTVAHQLIEVQGYNAFSYADIAAAVGIRKASIHYHFPNKHDLVRAVVARYRAATREQLMQIEHETSNACHKLQRYAITTEADSRGLPRICLCALLAAEFPTLPDDVRAEVEGFFIDQVTWLATVFRDGVAAGLLQLQRSIEIEAQLFLAALDGAVLVARAFNDPHRYDVLAQVLVAAYITER